MINLLQGKRILFANVPTDGHFNPLTALAKYLQAAGADVRWYTSAIYADKLAALQIPHYPFVHAREINGHNLLAAIPEMQTASGPEKGRLYLQHLFIDRSVEYYEDIKNIYSTFPFDVFVADNMFSAMPFVKHKLLVPVVAIGVIPLIEDSVDVAPAGRALPPAADAETREAYAQMYAQKYAGIRPLISLYNAYLQQHNISVAGSFIFDTLVKEADIFLQIGTPGFEYYRSDIGSNVKFIGALLPQQAPASSTGWFDARLKKYSKVLLVTQGTVEGDVSKIIAPTLKAFQNTDTLVIATTGGSGTQLLREKYQAENCIIEDYIPFNEVMPYVSVYVTNGGYGGTILSIMNGVPIVAAGVYELKNEICARIDHFGIGIDLQTETPSPEAIFTAAEKIMQDAAYKESITTLQHEMTRYDSFTLCTSYIAMQLNK
ncbi:glycosyltransferase [Deminuibacter soli]|uniref:Glycosyltransferase n=1 Tax=Deminuibacter soli TaxID=2291815 RepID=A0A3E1NKJ1_9BACT|nr:glycosyltransferase [Deminuibacter soli]RFM28455.1 glycosyltransferase [Deminuibacter soli]